MSDQDEEVWSDIRIAAAEYQMVEKGHAAKQGLARAANAVMNDIHWSSTFEGSEFWCYVYQRLDDMSGEQDD